MAIYDDTDELEDVLLARELQASQKPKGQTKSTDLQFGPYTPPSAIEDLSHYGTAPGGLGTVANYAGQGAMLGTMIPGVGNALGAGIGAASGGIAALFKNRTNDTKNQREDFARQLGLADTTALWGKLESELPADQAYELKNRALNRIGKKDLGANEQWMMDVQAALSAVQNQTDPTTTTTPTSTATPAVDGSGWDTDGYAAPGYVPQSYGNVMAGWDGTKWSNANHQTPKYAVGRILSQYSPSIENAGKAAEEIAKAYPGSTFNGKDKITIPGVGTIDVLTNSGSGQNMGWAWQPIESGSAAPTSSGVTVDGPSAFSRVQALVPTDSDFFQQLQQQLVQILGGSSAIDRQALLDMLTNRN